MATHDDEMEETWGRAATHAEHRVQDCIRYTLEGQTYTGTILWECAPAIRAGQHLPTRYVVQPDHKEEGSFDMVWSANIVIDEAHKQDASPNAISAASEQALIDMLATLSTPIFIQADTDDDGERFYVWSVGASTPEQPWGLYVGIHRQFLGAVKLALEKVIKCVQE